MILLWKNRKSSPQPEWSPSMWLHHQLVCAHLETEHGCWRGALGSDAQSACLSHTAAFSISLECEIRESDRIYFQFWELWLTNTFSSTAIFVGLKKKKAEHLKTRRQGTYKPTSSSQFYCQVTNNSSLAWSCFLFKKKLSFVCSQMVFPTFQQLKNVISR